MLRSGLGPDMDMVMDMVMDMGMCIASALQPNPYRIEAHDSQEQQTRGRHPPTRHQAQGPGHPSPPSIVLYRLRDVAAHSSWR